MSTQSFQSGSRTLAMRVRAFAMAAAMAAACLAGCSSDERANQMTSFSGKESKSATPELFTIPRKPDVSRASSDCRASEIGARPAPHRRGGLQRIQHHAGDHPGRRASQPDSGGAGRAREERPAAIGSQQPRLLAALCGLSESARHLSRRRTKITPARRISTRTTPSPSAICCRRNPIASRRRRI